MMVAERIGTEEGLCVKRRKRQRIRKSRVRKIKCAKAGGYYFYKKEEVQAFLRKRKAARGGVDAGPGG